MLTTREDFSKLKISEGADIFFTGLFLGHFGEERNIPIVRFGKVAMATNERILWKERGKPVRVQLYLVEIFSFGGNSGSPVFFFLGSYREPGSVILGPPVIKLAGIMKGSFDEGRPLVTIETKQEKLSTQNQGIAAVIPSYLLYEILYSGEVKALRAIAK